MKALIAAGGRGTRLRPITYSLNKHLIPLVNKPLIVYALEKIAEVGIVEVAINVNEGDTSLQELIGDGSAWGLQVTFIEQVGGALGVAHVIKNAQEFLGDDSFVFYLGDNIILGSIVDFVKGFEESQSTAFLALSKVPDPERFGVPEIDSEGNITRVLEKPENPPSDFAVTGIYCYTSAVHEAVNGVAMSDRGELEISDVHSWLIDNGKKVSYQVVDGWWKDTGKPLDMLEGNSLLMNLVDDYNGAAIVDDAVKITGAVHIGNGAKILGNTVIEGPVVIGENAVIENATLKPYACIGNGTSVRGATIEETIVMDDAVIHHTMHIKHSIIGHNATIVDHQKNDGYKMILGENTTIEL